MTYPHDGILPGFQWIEHRRSGGNPYVNQGRPQIVNHMTVTSDMSVGGIQAHSVPPQLWVNPFKRQRYQDIPLTAGGFALYQPQFGEAWLNKHFGCIQIEIVGSPVVNQRTFTDEQIKWLGEEVHAPIMQWFRDMGWDYDESAYHQVTDSSGSASEFWPGRCGDQEWINFSGMTQHIKAVGNDHWDCSVEWVEGMHSFAVAKLNGGKAPAPAPAPVEDEDDDMKYRTFVDDTNTLYLVDGLHAYAVGNMATYNTLAATGMVYTLAEMDARSWPCRYPRKYMMDVFIVEGIVENTDHNPDKPF